LRAWLTPFAVLACCLAGRLEARRGGEALAALPDLSSLEAADAARLGGISRLRPPASHRPGPRRDVGATGVRLALLAHAPRRQWRRGGSRIARHRQAVARRRAGPGARKLAAEARNRPEWKDWLGPRSRRLADALRRGDVPAELGQRHAGFLQAFGPRAVSEGELSALSWEDDPAPVLLALRGALASPRSAGFGHRAAAEVRHADEDALDSRLGFVRRALVGAALRGARDWVARREETKSMAVGLVQCGRRLARSAARRLLEQGALEAEHDVFFLTFDELREALGGAPAPATAIRRRRRRLEREGALQAPRDVDLEGPVSPVSAEGALLGIGVSPGVGVGRARVLSPGETPELLPGEVLVAQVLDAGHGPALAVAAGAVAEIGGLLSHGAVVARELGVPCVVDVREATRRLRTGDRVLVDGASGRVALMPETAVGEHPALLSEADRADEKLHELEAHPLARESVYFNAQDQAQDLFLVASSASGAAGEARRHRAAGPSRPVRTSGGTPAPAPSRSVARR
jgi:phosphohistidine swiveling domain-containing protein